MSTPIAVVGIVLGALAAVIIAYTAATLDDQARPAGPRVSAPGVPAEVTDASGGGRG